MNYYHIFQDPWSGMGQESRTAASAATR